MLTDTDPAAQVVLIGEDDNVPQVLLDAANNAVALSARTPPRTIESRCMSPEAAHRVISHSSRTWSEADINWQAKPADSVDSDPSWTWPNLCPTRIQRALAGLTHALRGSG